MDHTSCVSVRAQNSTRHPFEELQQAVSHPTVEAQFATFIKRTKIDYLEETLKEHNAQEGILPLLDLSFLKRFYELQSSFTGPNKLSSQIVQMSLALYQEFCLDNPTILSKFLQDTLASFCHEFVDSSAAEAEVRLQHLYQKFLLTPWMKSNCFRLADTQNTIQ